MRCDECGTEEATILIGHPGSPSPRTRLCAACASRRGVSGSGGTLRIDLGALFAAAGPEPGLPARACPRCGLSLEEFRRNGRFGCPDCVRTFVEALPSLAKRPGFAPGTDGIL